MSEELSAPKKKYLKPKRRLNGMERKLVRALASGKTLTQAALDAGYSSKCPAQCGYQALRRLGLSTSQVLDAHGLNVDALIHKYLKPALEASETKFFQKDGIVTDTRDVVAWGPRLQALENAFRLHGAYAPEETSKEPSKPFELKVNIVHIGNQSTVEIANARDSL